MMSPAQRFRNADRQELEQVLMHSRSQMLRVFEVYEKALHSSAYSVQQLPILNAPLWEFGHIGWFQERWLLRNTEKNKGMHCPSEPKLLPSMLSIADGLFDSSNVPHATRWHLSLPAFEQLQSYLTRVLDASIDALRQGGQSPNDLYFYWLCAAHEDMHFEAFCYMANTLGIGSPDQLRQLGLWSEPRQGIVESELQKCLFFFDNENAFEQTRLAPCNDLDALPVSWEQFKQFFSGAAYDQQENWSEQGWRWKCEQSHAQHVRPCALIKDDSSSAAVHVNYWQAQAWCKANHRGLPSEQQWLTAMAASDLHWGHVWEWTNSNFVPLHGAETQDKPFDAHPYRDYSLPWFGNGFKVLKGGSIYTHNRMKHPLYRNFYTPARSDILCGFRSCSLM